MIKVLVTGGLGFIGSNLVDLLVKHGYEVTIIDNRSTGRIENLNQKAKYIEGDIRDGVLIDDLPEMDYVFHLASLARIQPSIDDPISAHDVNINGTLNILEYCHRTGAKLIFSSSSSIYAGKDLPTDEASKKEPKSPYALQKLQCEQYIEIYSQLYDMDYTILRYFNVFGPRQILEGAYAAVVGIFLDQKAKGEKLTVTGDGENKRDFTYVEDVARANMLAMDWPRDVYNIGTGENFSINQIADLVGGEKTYIPARKGEVRETLASNAKARAQGWKPTKSIEEWLAEQ